MPAVKWVLAGVAMIMDIVWAWGVVREESFVGRRKMLLFSVTSFLLYISMIVVCCGSLSLFFFTSEFPFFVWMFLSELLVFAFQTFCKLRTKRYSFVMLPTISLFWIPLSCCWFLSVVGSLRWTFSKAKYYKRTPKSTQSVWIKSYSVCYKEGLTL